MKTDVKGEINEGRLCSEEDKIFSTGLGKEKEDISRPWEGKESLDSIFTKLQIRNCNW